jgi:hypothetical protein
LNKRAFRQVLATRLLELGYVLESPDGYDLVALSAKERLLVDVRGDEETPAEVWRSFVGALARATLRLEESPRGTLCLAFASDYADALAEHLGRIDPRIVVVFRDADGEIRRLRGAWDVPPREELGFAATVVVRTPGPARHPDGRFVIGEIAYEVRAGSVVWTTEGGALVFPPPTFLDLCRRAGLTAATETAPAILHRAAVERSARIAGAA